MKKTLAELSQKYGSTLVDEEEFKKALNIKEEKVWKPKPTELYWYINQSGLLNNSIFSDYQTDIKQFEIGNIYKTEEEAEFARDKKLFEVKMERYLREHEDEPVDWGNESQAKYSLEFNFRIGSKICIVANSYYMKQGSIYTTNFEALNSYVKDNEADIKKYLFGVE